MEHGLLAKSPRIEVGGCITRFCRYGYYVTTSTSNPFLIFMTSRSASSAFMEAMDKGIWETLFFLFSGKAYRDFLPAVFGFSFFIQYNNQAKKGKDFRLRFLWRLFLLFIIGCFNGAFFPGDILVLYSIIGVVLVLVCRWSDRAILIAAIILMLQPLELGKFFYAMINPDYVPAAGVWRVHSQRMYPFLSQPDFWAMVKSNLWDGQLFSLLWAWGVRTFFSRLPLCSCGYADGTQTVVCQPVRTSGFFRMRTLVIGAVCFVPLYFITLCTF